MYTIRSQLITVPTEDVAVAVGYLLALTRRRGAFVPRKGGIKYAKVKIQRR